MDALPTVNTLYYVAFVCCEDVNSQGRVCEALAMTTKTEFDGFLKLTIHMPDETVHTEMAPTLVMLNALATLHRCTLTPHITAIGDNVVYGSFVFQKASSP